MYNRILNHTDLQNFREQIKENKYDERFPHRDLWPKADANLKWFSILNSIQSLEKSNLDIVDLGSGPASLPHILSDLGHKVTAIDITDLAHLCFNSLVKMVLGDALIELKEMEDETVDVFYDSCAVTHFDTNLNSGWKQVAKESYRSLRSGGHFITSSDVEIGSEDGEFVGPHKIIEIMESVGYKLTSDYDKKSENTNFADPYKVVCLTFKK